MKLEVNKQSSICVNDCIFFDPLDIDENKKAKYIFITHPHWDHFSVKDINKILTKETIIICPRTMEKDVVNFDNKIVLVEPEKNYELPDLNFSTFYSYNIGKQYHPKENKWVGYSVEIENKIVVVTGDSDNTPELRKLKADILFLPIGGKFTMNVKEAIDLTNTINPKKVVPTHYGEIVGNNEMGKEFFSLLNKDIDCEILL